MSSDRFLRAPHWAFALLQNARLGRLGTADGEGRPHVVPLCYAFDGRAIWSGVDHKPKGAKLLKRHRNIEENPQVTLLVDVWDEDWSRLRWVMVHGRAELVASEEDFDYAVELLVAKYRQYREQPPLSLDEGGTMIKIAPERVVAWRAEEDEG